MTEIKSLSIDELKSALKEMGEKPFRAGQIFKWLHEGVESFEEMSNLSKDLRARLAENFLLTVPEVARKQVSRVDGTVKYLWRLRDGNCVESVLMHYEHGVSAVSSWEHRLHLLPGRLPDGLRFLRLHNCWQGKRLNTIRTLGPGDFHPKGLGFERVQHCADGHRRAARQLRQRAQVPASGELPGGNQHRTASYLLVNQRNC